MRNSPCPPSAAVWLRGKASCYLLMVEGAGGHPGCPTHSGACSCCCCSCCPTAGRMPRSSPSSHSSAPTTTRQACEEPRCSTVQYSAHPPGSYSRAPTKSITCTSSNSSSNSPVSFSSTTAGSGQQQRQQQGAGDVLLYSSPFRVTFRGSHTQCSARCCCCCCCCCAATTMPDRWLTRYPA